MKFYAAKQQGAARYGRRGPGSDALDLCLQTLCKPDDPARPHSNQPRHPASRPPPVRGSGGILGPGLTRATTYTSKRVSDS